MGGIWEEVHSETLGCQLVHFEDSDVQVEDCAGQGDEEMRKGGKRD